MKVYYSHCMAIYHTPQEDRDLETIKKIFKAPGTCAEIINPSDVQYSYHADLLKKDGRGDEVMPFFENLVTECDVLIFRAAINGSIPSGVYKEIQTAIEHGMPVIELPSMILSREMTLDQTRQMLSELGQR